MHFSKTGLAVKQKLPIFGFLSTTKLRIFCRYGNKQVNFTFLKLAHVAVLAVSEGAVFVAVAVASGF